MITIQDVRMLALSMPEAVEKMHFEKPSFRVRSKIFATVAVAENMAVVKLTDVDQSVFCDYDGMVFSPVPGAWGKLGWTRINLKKVRKEMFRDALVLSYKLTAPKTLVRKHFPEE